MTNWRDTCGRLRDSLRLGVQSAFGAALAYWLGHAAGLPELSWAVFSALYVAQRNLDATLAEASGRIGGTLAGSAVGLMVVLLLPHGDAAIWRLIITAVLMTGFSVLFPTTHYGIAVAAVIVLPSGDAVLESATSRGLAIGLGTLMGTASVFLVWPESAARRSRRAAIRSIATCRELLEVEFGQFLDEDGSRLDELQLNFLQELREAREMAGIARLRVRDKVGLEDLIEASSRLWHTLVILDRMQKDRRWREDVGDKGGLHAPLGQVRTQMCEVLAAITAGQPVETDGAQAAVRQSIAAVEARADRVTLEPLSFALDHLAQDLKALVTAATAHRRRGALA